MEDVLGDPMGEVLGDPVGDVLCDLWGTLKVTNGGRSR